MPGASAVPPLRARPGLRSSGPRSKIVSLAEAAGRIPDGCRLAIGGFAVYQHPMALVRELARQGRRDLTVVGAVKGNVDYPELLSFDRFPGQPGSAHVLAVRLPGRHPRRRTWRCCATASTRGASCCRARTAGTGPRSNRRAAARPLE